MPPMDAYLMRRQLLDDMSSNRVWTVMSDAYYRSISGADYHTARGEELALPPLITNSPDQIRRTATRVPADPDLIVTYPDAVAYRRRVARTAQMAHTYYVTPEMTVLVTAAAEEMPGDERVHAEDFPTEHGFLLIPHGITQVDIRGSAVVTSAILWNILGGRIHVTYLADKTHPLDRLNVHAGLRAAALEEGHLGEDAEEIWKRIPRLTPWHDMFVDIGHTLPTALTLGMVIPPEYSDRIVVSQESGNTTISWGKGYGPDELMDEISRSVAAANSTGGVVVEPVFRWLTACLRLMQQPIAHVKTQGIPANMRRPSVGKTKMRNSAVTVIEYRRREYGEMPDPSERHFTHRFFRRGHWRQQPYKTADGEWDRKRIWIHPTIVGDESLPLRLREHVNALVR